MSYAQIISLLIFWAFLVVGHKVMEENISDISERLRNLLGNTSNGLQNWAINFIAQLEPTRAEIFRRINKDSDWETIAKVVTADDIEKHDIPIIRKRIVFEKISGEILGFIGLASLLYADAVEGVTTYSLIFSSSIIPPILNIPQTTHIVIVIIGLCVINGLHFADILGVSSFTSSSQITRPVMRKINLSIRTASLLLAIIFLTLALIEQANISTFAIALLIMPMLITTALGFEFMTGGMFVFLSFDLFILSILFKLAEWILYFALRILKDFIYYQWLFFDTIFATPLRSIMALRNKR